MLVAMLSRTIHARIVHGVGYDDDIPPDTRDQPYLPTSFDTTLISTHHIREAVLSCTESIALFRTVTCDIITYDSCGNPYAVSGNETQWTVQVQHQTTHQFSRLVSPIIFLKPAVVRFYFTPIEVGVYEVVVHLKAKHTPLYVPLPLRQYVVVHNTIAKCTQSTILHTQAQVARTTWAASSFQNEYPEGGIAGLAGLSIPTSVVVDREWIYPEPDHLVESRTRRVPLEPRPLTKISDPLLPGKNNFKYCDVIEQS